MLTPTTVWRISRELVLALDEHLGTPTDSYVNGSQTWIADNGPRDATLEWRLHPVAGYRAPDGVSHYELWEQVVAGLSAGTPAEALELGSERRALSSLWDGLECFPAYAEEVEPAALADAAVTVLGVVPERAGLVDHRRIGDLWEQARGDLSIVDVLIDELDPGE